MHYDVADDTDLGFLDTFVDVMTAPVRVVGRVAKGVAEAILPDDVVDFVANIVESAWDFGEDVVVEQLQDPKTWAVVGAAVATVATGGIAAPLAASVAAETLTAKVVAGVSDKAYKAMTSEARKALVEKVGAKNPQKFKAAVARTVAGLQRDPRWEKARFKAEVAALKKSGIDLGKYQHGVAPNAPVYQAYRKAIDAGSGTQAAVAAARAKAERIDRIKGESNERDRRRRAQVNQTGKETFKAGVAALAAAGIDLASIPPGAVPNNPVYRAYRNAVESGATPDQAVQAAKEAVAAATPATESKGPPVALIAGGLAAAAVIAVVIARRRKGRR